MLKHKKTSAIPDGGDSSLVQPSDWNDDHQVNGGFDLPFENVSAPPANTVRLFGGKLGGRMMPAFEAPDGVTAFIQPSFAKRRVALWSAISDTTSTSSFGLPGAAMGTATVAGINPSSLPASVRRLDYLVTTASATAIAGWASSSGINNHIFIGSTAAYGGFHIAGRFGGATGMTNAAHRFYAGLSSTAMNYSDVEPSSRANLIGVGYDSGDANWQLMHKTGTGEVTKVDLGANFPRQVGDRSKMYDLVLYCVAGGTSVFYEFTDLVTGAVAAGEITTNLPAGTQTMRFAVAASVGGTSSIIGVSMAQVYIETGY